MSVLGKIFGNNVTKREQKGCKTRAKGVLKIESVDRPIYDIISFVLLLLKLIISMNTVQPRHAK